MTESADWQKSLETFQAFSDKLTRESIDLKVRIAFESGNPPLTAFPQTRLEQERREAKRLTGQVGLERVRQDKLEASLRATDSAREKALEKYIFRGCDSDSLLTWPPKTCRSPSGSHGARAAEKYFDLRDSSRPGR